MRNTRAVRARMKGMNFGGGVSSFILASGAVIVSSVGCLSELPLPPIVAGDPVEQKSIEYHDGY